MDGLLTRVSTSYKNSEEDRDDALIEVPKRTENYSKPSVSQISTPEECLEILKNEPDHQILLSALKYLSSPRSDFEITYPSPLAAQLVHVLVSSTVPNYWAVFNGSEDAKTRKRRQPVEMKNLLSCLRSVIGLSAILLCLKQRIHQSRESKKPTGGPNVQEALSIYLQLLQAILDGEDIIQHLWKSIQVTSDSRPRQQAIWNECLSLFGGGKLLGIAAEAEDVMRSSGKADQKFWIGNGKSFSAWMARNIAHWIRNLDLESESEGKRCSEFLSKSFRLGYKEIITKVLMSSLLLESEDQPAQFRKLIENLPNHEQRDMLYTIINILSRDYLSAEALAEANSEWWKSDANLVSATAALINLVLGEDDTRKGHLISWLTNSSKAGVGDGISIRRAAVAAIAGNKNDLETVLEKSFQQFGDQLYIRHTPTIQQEAHAQVLLLVAGYVHRNTPLSLTMMMRSGTHLNAVSNRLAASSPRARFLGMVVGEALSNLVDRGDKKMDFKTDDMITAEAKWYKSLVNIADESGVFDLLKQKAVVNNAKKTPPRVQKPAARSESNLITTVPIKALVEELDDAEDDNRTDEDGLETYSKPDSDAEDSDEDPTLITRNKPLAPVYVRDLINYLRDSENYDKQKLGLQTAAPLIRRKANFGTEVSSHIEELATLLVGIQDKYEIENFYDMRLQGMVAILIAQPLKMGQWFSKTFFDGDYSISQRASVLTALGLGTRELGGFGSEHTSVSSKHPLPSTSFPSKTLPNAMHKRYTTPSASDLTAVAQISTHLSNTMIAPMAADLADKLTGPSILKVRTFSSRMSVEAKRKKPTTNALAKIVSDGFFFPLTGRFFVHLKAYSSSSSTNVIFQPHLLSHFLKTLSLLLHSSGPNTLSLPQMTSEFWDLLLALRTQSLGDIVVIEAMLFSFLMMLEMNEDKRRLVDAQGRQVLETQEWVEGVFGRVGRGGSEEDERVKMLAAAVLVRIREVVETYQALLMGDLASF